MKGSELYFLGHRLMSIAAVSLSLRRVKAGARLVLEDVVQHPGTTPDEIAGRTGLQSAQVSALLADLAAEDLTVNTADGERVNVGRSLLERNDAPDSVDDAIAAVLGTPADSAEVNEVSGLLEALSRRLGPDRGMRAAGFDFDAA